MCLDYTSEHEVSESRISSTNRSEFPTSAMFELVMVAN